MGFEIAVLGGAGDMGSRAVAELAYSGSVSRLTVIDRNRAAGEALARQLAAAPANIVVQDVDAMDHQALVEVLRGHDVVASALGPFHVFEARAAAAALDAGVDYASICDEWEAAEEVFTRFGERAAREGRIVLTGLGTSPGITNVGVRYLAQGLDRIQRADIHVYQPLDGGGGEAVVRHMLFIMSGSVAVWRGGRRVMVAACSEEREVELPRFGRMRLWNMGHSEPLTIPRYFPQIENVGFFMGFGRGSGLLVGPARRGWWQRPRLREWAVRALVALERTTRRRSPAPGAVRIDVEGTVDGRPVHRMVCGVGEMRQATGISLAIGTLMLAKRQLTTEGGGVHAPEGCIDPQAFIRALRRSGIEAYTDVAMRHPLEAD